MVTKRLHSGVLSSRLKARCWPCLKPPPASRIGRLVLSCVFASPMLLPKRIIVRSSSRVVAFTLVGEVVQQLAQQRHLLAVGVFELLHLVRGLAVMAEVVVAVGRVLVGCSLKTGVAKASTISVTMRVESDSSASCAIDSIRSNFSKNSFLS